MCDFKPGDEVVCVDASLYEPGPWLGDPPVEGCVYVVDALSHFRGEPHLHLAEISNHYGLGGNDLGYRARRFRKVQRKNPRLAIETFMTMPGGFEEPKRKIPAKEPA